MVIIVQIQVFMRALEKYPFHSYGLIDAPKILADIVESTIKAIYVDSNSYYMGGLFFFPCINVSIMS